eukprot:9973945-Karenia_brevis.AAC.1
MMLNVPPHVDSWSLSMMMLALPPHAASLSLSMTLDMPPQLFSLSLSMMSSPTNFRPSWSAPGGVFE